MKPEEKIERAYEELRSIIDGGSESFTHEDAVQYLKDKLAQRTWVWLTDREKSNLWLESRAAIPRFHTYASLVEAKLKEKNT